jgi:ATP-dependent DNA ligase
MRRGLAAEYLGRMLALRPPIEPMLARLAKALPEEGCLYEPKWDGFRGLVFKDGDDVYLQSRDGKPFNRYFPELLEPLRHGLPPACVVDGEIVIAREGKLDFEALLQRIHPAASRVALLSRLTPASYVIWDVLALEGRDLRALTQAERRAELERSFAQLRAPIHLTPATLDRRIAEEWFERFEGAGLDGVVAKPLSLPYVSGKRVMFKVKHERTADCVVAGFRWYKGGRGELVGSLLLGLYDDAGMLHHVGIAAAFKREERARMAREFEALRRDALEAHPWRAWAEASGESQRMPGGPSRWNAGKDLSWEPLRIERVCEVAYDHLQGDRFRHATQFRRWRPDREPHDCRYAQLEETPAFELAEIFGRE